MLYVFVDESYPHSEIMVFACVAVGQDFFSRRWYEIEAIKRQGLQKRESLIEELLAADQYRVLISSLDMPGVARALGDPDALGRKGWISQRDNLWSQAFGYSVARSIPLKDWVFNAVDIYHDPKTLKKDHEEGFQEKLREVVTRLASKEVARSRPHIQTRLQIRRIVSVKKPPTGETPTKYQAGTWLAHSVAGLASKRSSLMSHPHVKQLDLNPLLEKIVQSRPRGFVSARVRT